MGTLYRFGDCRQIRKSLEDKHVKYNAKMDHTYLFAAFTVVASSLCFRALRVPISSRMLSDILSRLVETIAEQGEDMQVRYETIRSLALKYGSQKTYLMKLVGLL